MNFEQCEKQSVKDKAERQVPRSENALDETTLASLSSGIWLIFFLKSTVSASSWSQKASVSAMVV